MIALHNHARMFPAFVFVSTVYLLTAGWVRLSITFTGEQSGRRVLVRPFRFDCLD